MTTKYTVFGDKVSFETTGSDKIHYSYDASGNLFSMNLNGTEYYYVRNTQGDITGLIDNAGNLVVSYTYDTWGKLISTTGSLASTVGVKNPYRYRGYRYDTETGFYSLQSRYYDPEIGRWINPEPNAYVGAFDEGAGLLGYNVYAYCANNPINLFDPTGEFVISTLVICVVGGAIIGGTAGGYASYKIQGIVNWRWVTGGALAGGALGYFIAPAVASATGVAGVSITLKGGITLIPTTLLGQYHHVLSNPLMKALNSHSLKGLYQRAGSMVQALYEYSHKGYQTWHRAIDNYMVRWLQNNPKATSNQFWGELYNQYNTKDLIKRFGEGVLDYIKKQIK